MRMLSFIFSKVFRKWAQLELAPGYLYSLCDRYGKYLYKGQLQKGILPNRFQIPCDLSDHVQRQIWLYGVYEPVESYLFQQFLKPGMIFFDLGANVGQYSLLAATEVGPLGQVHGFEAQKDNFEKFKSHCQLNSISGIIFPQFLAVWNEETLLEMKMPDNMTNNAGSFYAQKTEASSDLLKIKAVRLDQYILHNHIPRIDLIKMDIEGAEFFALEGAEASIKKFLPVIFMEINQAALEKMGCQATSISEKLFSWGYKAFQIGHSAETSGMITDLSQVVQSNLIFHINPLPQAVLSGWTLKTALQWARQGWQNPV